MTTLLSIPDFRKDLPVMSSPERLRTITDIKSHAAPPLYNSIYTRLYYNPIKTRVVALYMVKSTE